jgi:hypothetical protein
MQTARITGLGKSATTPPVTWRNRQRRAPKNKAPITRSEALTLVRQLEAKYRSQQAEQQVSDNTPTEGKPSEWDGDRFIEGITHARLCGDMAQAFVELIERITDVEPESKARVVGLARSASKRGYGSVRAREAMLDAPTPDHVNKRDGDRLVKSYAHYEALASLCKRFANLILNIAEHPNQIAA